MKHATIFTVTTMHEKDSRYGGSPRVVGWFQSIEDAADIIETNNCDIHEGTYTYAIIEEVTVGLYPRVTNEIWYEWFSSETDGERYKKIDKPTKFESIVNWSFG